MRGVILIILVLDLAIICHQQHFRINPFDRSYPFGNLNVLDHQEEILDNLRVNLSIQFKAEIINSIFMNSTKEDSTIGIKNLEFQKFLIRIQQKPPTAEQVFQPPKRITNDDEFKLSLGDFCAVYNLGYWHFEWCHKKEVKQSHFEFLDYGQKSVLQAGHLIGRYTSTKFEREGENADEKSPIVKIIDTFTDGEICDVEEDDASAAGAEVHNHPPIYREAKAIIKCCYNDKDKLGQPIIYIDNVIEVTKCSYVLQICASNLCPPTSPIYYNQKQPHHHHHHHVANINPSQELNRKEIYDQFLFNTLHSLKHICLYHYQPWWTYELCFNTGIRQYHVEIEKPNLSKGVRVFYEQEVIRSEFILGLTTLDDDIRMNETIANITLSMHFDSFIQSIHKLDENRQDYKSSSSSHRYHHHHHENGVEVIRDMSTLPASGMPLSTLSKTSSSSSSSSVGPKSIILEFTNGTLCDIIDSVTRSSTVHISCGPRDAIIDVIEDRTCHYNIKVTSPLICQHSEFAPTKVQMETVELLPVDLDLFNNTNDDDDDNNDNGDDGDDGANIYNDVNDNNASKQ